jgi:PAS domain S-box-containing protein
MTDIDPILPDLSPGPPRPPTDTAASGLPFVVHVSLIVLTTIFVTAAVMSALAYYSARLIIIQEAERSVGIVAETKREELLSRVGACQSHAQTLLGELDRLRHAQRTEPERLIQSELQTYLRTEHASSALLKLRGGPVITAGVGVDSMAHLLTPNDNQLGLFYRQDHKSLYLVHARSPNDSELTVCYPSDRIDQIFQAHSGLGDDGETFLADPKGHFLTPGRYTNQDVSHPIYARPMQMCLAGADGQILAPDYRDVDTIMAYRYVRPLGGCAIMAHMSKAEAFMPLMTLRFSLLTLMAGLAAIGVLVAIGIGRWFARPIELLKQRAVVMRRGDFDSPVPVTGPLEVRLFASTFAHMAADLKQTHQALFGSHQELEGRVEQRMQELSIAYQEQHVAYEKLEAQSGELAAQQAKLLLTNQELANQRSLFAGLVKTMPLGLAFFSRDLVLTLANPAYIQQMAIDDDCIGRHVTSIFAGENSQQLASIMREIVASGEAHNSLEFPFSYDYEGRHHEGLWDVFRTPVKNEQGEVLGVLALIQDVSERVALTTALRRRSEELDAQRALTERIIDNAPVAIAYLDADLRYVWNNEYHAKLLGLPQSAIIQHHVTELLPEATLAKTLALYRQALETRQPFSAISLPIQLRQDDDATTYWDISYVPIENGSSVGLLMLGVEVSERVERERLQKERIEQLTHLDKMKDQFLSILSHELRTPLNAVLGFASVLDDEVFGPLTDEQHTYMAKILGGTEVLLALINDLLDMSRIQAGKFQLTLGQVNLANVVKQTTDNLAGLAERRHHRFECDIPDSLPAIVADEQRVAQVIVNLVGNAIKFSPDASVIVIRARMTEAEIICEVIDEGAGIEAQDLAKLFTPFTQLDMSNTRAASGTGLGLSIAKALVEAHGGRIGVESAPERGSRFWFTLPV